LLLTIDDEPVIRHAIAGMAARSGFDCIEAASKPDIVRALDRAPDVILLDLTMPDMDGHEVMWEMHRRRSRASIILSSGYLDEVIQVAELYARKAGLNYLCRLDKPYPPASLMRLLSAVRERVSRPPETMSCSH